jgi:hypothetical protein
MKIPAGKSNSLKGKKRVKDPIKPEKGKSNE